MIRIASLFSGIGGFERGFQQASNKTEIVFSSEIDKYARQIYKKNFGVEPYGDITQINATDIPDHDILCGGFPCQAFSIAGKRRGFEDTRGTLFFEIMRIAEAKRPKLLFLENVRGLLSHDEGRTFQTVLRSMDDLGYDAEWQVFNSKNHGVPQNRERVFIIGHIRRSGSRQIFPITENESISNEEYPVVHCIDANYYKGPAQQPRTMIQCATGVNVPSRGAEPRKDGMACVVKAGECGTKNIVCIPVLTPDRENKRQQGRRFKEDGDPSFTVTAQDRHGILIATGVNNKSSGVEIRNDGIASCIKPQSGSQTPTVFLCDSGQDRHGVLINPSSTPSNTFSPMRWARTEKGKIARAESYKHGSDCTPFGDGCRELVTSSTDISGCITNALAKDSLLGNGSDIRKLTPTECERLQGFPDGWTAEGIDADGNVVTISDTQRYKCLGNAVTVNVIEFIARHIITTEFGE